MGTLDMIPAVAATFIVGDPNILTGDNRTFEGGIGDWTVGGACTIAQDATWAHGGTKSLGLTPTALAPTATILSSVHVIPVVPGGTYRLSVYGTSAGGLSRNVSLSRATFTSGGSFVGFSSDNTANTFNATAGVWVLATHDFTPEATSAWCQITIGSSNMTAAGGQLAWFDDISVVRTA